MSWKDNLKSSLGTDFLNATMSHIDGDVERYILKQDDLYQSVNRRGTGFTPYELIHLEFNQASGLYNVNDYISGTVISRHVFMDFLHGWAHTGFYIVTVNGREI